MSGAPPTGEAGAKSGRISFVDKKREEMDRIKKKLNKLQRALPGIRESLNIDISKHVDVLASLEDRLGLIDKYLTLLEIENEIRKSSDFNEEISKEISRWNGIKNNVNIIVQSLLSAGELDDPLFQAVKKKAQEVQALIDEKNMGLIITQKIEDRINDIAAEVKKLEAQILKREKKKKRKA